MRIRKHVPAPGGKWCLFCGSLTLADGTWPAGISCNEREDGISQHDLRPEPERRQYACDHIGDRLVQLRRRTEDERNAVHCAAMQGKPQDQCEQCAGLDCLVCNVKRARAAADCVYCHRPGQTSLPCPSRDPYFGD